MLSLLQLVLVTLHKRKHRHTRLATARCDGVTHGGARVQELYSYVCPDIAKEFAKYDAEPSKWIQKYNGVQAPPPSPGGQQTQNQSGSCTRAGSAVCPMLPVPRVPQNTANSAPHDSYALCMPRVDQPRLAAAHRRAPRRRGCATWRTSAFLRPKSSSRPRFTRPISSAYSARQSLCLLRFAFGVPLARRLVRCC